MQSIIFIIVNIIHAGRLMLPKDCKRNNLLIGRPGYYDILQIMRLYKASVGIDLGRPRKIVYLLLGKKLIICARDNNKIIGFMLFYFNKRDATEDTIHEGYIFVSPMHRGFGVATAMRQYAIEHFRRCGRSGISSRISASNLPSLQSAQKVGYRIVEEYFDCALNEKRYYLVVPLSKTPQAE